VINFKQPEERAPSALILLSIVILAGTLAYMLFVPPPSAAGLAKGRALSRQKIEDEIAATRKQTQQAQKQVAARIWRGNAETITAAVLAKLTEQANRQALKLTAFRPQRPQQVPGVTELPYSVQISGPYPVVRAMLEFLDHPGNKLVLRSVQIAASDAASSMVTATVGISAYTESTEPTTQQNTRRSVHG